MIDSVASFTKDKCYLCLRITREKREEIIKGVWEDKEIIDKIMNDVDMIFPYAYAKSPYKLCKSKIGLMSGLLYLLGIRYDYKTQVKIANSIPSQLHKGQPISTVTVRHNKNFWLENFGELFEDIRGDMKK